LPPLAAGYSKLRPAVPAREATIPSSELSHRGRSAIIVDEWGPYDWKLPKLVQVRGTPSSSFQLLTLGPPGSWRVVDRRGTDSLSSRSGKIGDTLTVTPSRDSEGDWALVLEYRGRAGRTQRFSYNRFDPVIDWNVGFFAWTDSLTDPRAKPEAFGALLRSTPLVALHAARLDYEWYRPSIPGIPDDHFAAQARGSVTLGEGTYTLRTISDDAIRVWVDDSLVIDDWKPHESEVDFAPLTGGRHDLRVQYVQVDGYAELRLDILKGVNRSAGSPPPHGN
jgi:hypothetical protein